MNKMQEYNKDFEKDQAENCFCGKKSERGMP